jgi:uncharacterized protein YjgD (DUF1641 family)
MSEEEILARLKSIEDKIEGVSRVEEQLQDLGRSWENLRDLGRDLSLVIDPAVRNLTEELAEVESGFQLEDLLAFMKKVLPSLRYLTWSLEQMENLIDWWRDMEPLLKIAVPKFIDYMDELDQKGVFRMNGAILEMFTKIARTYSPEDIDAIGDGFVQMHGIVRKFGSPQVIRFMEHLADLPAQVDLDQVKPAGPLGMLWRLRSPECREGLGVMVELTRALGKLEPGNGRGGAPEGKG